MHISNESRVLALVARSCAVASILIVGTLAINPVMACYQPPSPADVNVLMLNSPTALMATFRNGSIFAPPSTPATCACGLLVPTNLTVTSATVVDANGVAIPQFTGFSSNSTTASTLQALSPAPAGYVWYGFASPVTSGLVNGAPAAVTFNLTSSTPGDSNTFLAQIRGGKLGSAQSDSSGGNFDPIHRAITFIGLYSSTVPTLSEWGMIILVTLMVVTGLLIMRRRRTAPAQSV